MKRTATAWAGLLGYPIPAGHIILPQAEADDLAELLRAMVAEREAMDNYARNKYCPDCDPYVDPHVSQAQAEATAARRRAEGEE